MSDTRMQCSAEIIVVIERLNDDRFTVKTKNDDKEQLATLRVGDTLTIAVPLYVTEIK